MSNDWKNNKAVLDEIRHIKEVIQDITDVVPYCGRAGGVNQDGSWKYGFVTVSYPTKGSVKLTKLLDTEGYIFERIKEADYENHHSGYVMRTVATKTVELVY